ncbi:hypothetical protein [Thermococcus sp. 2319x1]|nr:hypothetical protein [Thermococcus sp. 2319x1]
MVYVLVEEEISKGKLRELVVLIGDKERINNFIYETLNKFIKMAGVF